MSHLISIIVPCYNEEEMIPVFFEITENISLPGEREYIFVNDGSTDHSLEEMNYIGTKVPSSSRKVYPFPFTEEYIERLNKNSEMT